MELSSSSFSFVVSLLALAVSLVWRCLSFSRSHGWSWRISSIVL